LLGVRKGAGGDRTYASALLGKEATGPNFSEVFKGVTVGPIWRQPECRTRKGQGGGFKLIEFGAHHNEEGWKVPFLDALGEWCR
jgi:hypothetical protein